MSGQWYVWEKREESLYPHWWPVEDEAFALPHAYVEDKRVAHYCGPLDHEQYHSLCRDARVY